MEYIQNWNSINEKGSYNGIELGGHICIIKGVRDCETKNGGKMLKIMFDFEASDKQGGWFQETYDYDKMKDDNAKWRNNGILYQTYGNDIANEYFKAFINRICETNIGYTWNFDERTLVGKAFGGVFGREEYINNKGESKFAIRCVRIKNADGIEKEPIPEDKLLKNSKSATNGIVEIAEEDLPF